MAYVKQVWKNLPLRETPISAARLNHLETQYDEAVSQSNSYADSLISGLPPAPVSSVNGMTGAVKLTAEDIGALSEQGPLDPRLVTALTGSGETLIAFAGSSTTGIGEYPRFLMGYINSQWRTGFNLTLAQASGFSWPSGLHSVNAGVSAVTSSTYLNSGRGAGISALNPSVVFHSVGSTDWASGRTPSVYAAGLESSISSITSSKPLLHVIVHQHARTDTTGSYSWDDMGAAARQVAQDADNRIFIDASKEFHSLGVGRGLDNRYGLMSSDGVHLTTHGHQVLASIVAHKLGILGRLGSDWVDISSSLTSGTTLHEVGHVRAKRSGDLVSLDLHRVRRSFAAGTPVDILQGLPEQFKSTRDSGHVVGSVWTSEGSSLGTLLVRAGGSVGVTTHVNAAEIRARLTYLV